MAERAAPALSVDSISRSYGAVRAVEAVSFALTPGTLTCLIGPNGAGKSTLVYGIAGTLATDDGRVFLGAQEVTRWPTHRRAKAGLATVFQVLRAPALDVRSSTMVGCHAWTRTGFLGGVLRPPWQRREEQRIREEADRALALVGLAARSLDRADTLALGQLRLLAVARAVAQRPSVLLLDEPAAGLRAVEKQRLAAALLRLRQRGLTVLLIEHDMQFVGSVADRLLVLDRGRLIADGTPAEVRDDERVMGAYLGRTAEL